MSGFSGIFTDLLSRITNVEKRISTLESFEYIRFYPIIGATDYIVQETLLTGASFNTGNLRGVGGIGEHAKGILATLWITAGNFDTKLRFTPSQDTPGDYSQQYRWEGAAGEDRQLMTQNMMLFLGPDGSFDINCLGASVQFFMVAFGYWE